MQGVLKPQIGPIYRDPRGKVGRDGSQEHCFIVRSGAFIEVVRADSLERAEKLRTEAIA